jgi:UDPglucose--hexose-1-phosphate uridylyltransferase
MTSYNELRKDYLLNRWVVIAKERSRRPTDLAKPRPEVAKTQTCPLCVGNEHMTPPAILLFQKVGDEIKRGRDPPEGPRPTNWLVRTIPNLYPAFTPPTHPQDTVKIFNTADFGYAIGYHEVVIESPNHDESPAVAELPQLELIINSYIDRYKALSSKSYVKYISIFRNYGLEAGASLSHTHSQIIATPMVPSTIQEEQQAADAYSKVHGKCAFCDIIERETKTQRQIMENADYAVIAPYGSINPMEFWILPKKHAPNIANLTPEEVKSLAFTLKTSLKALKDLVNDPPYNFGIHQTIDDGYHWHIEVYPKLTTWAGFEKSTGVYINTVTPESAAEALKKAIKP